MFLWRHFLENCEFFIRQIMTSSFSNLLVLFLLMKLFFEISSTDHDVILTENFENTK